MEKHQFLKDIKSAGWSVASIQWLANRIESARRQGKKVIVRTGFMGGTAVYMVPKGKEISSMLRYDLEEKSPLPEGVREIVIGEERKNKNGNETSEGSEARQIGEQREEANNPQRLQSFQKAHQNSRAGRRGGRPRKLPMGAGSVENDD